MTVLVLLTALKVLESQGHQEHQGSHLFLAQDLWTHGRSPVVGDLYAGSGLHSVRRSPRGAQGLRSYADPKRFSFRAAHRETHPRGSRNQYGSHY